MDYFSIRTATLIVRLLKSEARYIPSLSSAKCPLCGNWGERANNASRRRTDRVYRYFKCPECGYQYVAYEDLTPAVEKRMKRMPVDE